MARSRRSGRFPGHFQPPSSPARRGARANDCVPRRVPVRRRKHSSPWRTRPSCVAAIVIGGNRVRHALCGSLLSVCFRHEDGDDTADIGATCDRPVCPRAGGGRGCPAGGDVASRMSRAAVSRATFSGVGENRGETMGRIRRPSGHICRVLLHAAEHFRGLNVTASMHTLFCRCGRAGHPPPAVLISYPPMVYVKGQNPSEK